MREESGLSLRHVARAAGISAAFLTDIEHGRRMPSRRVLEELAKAIARPQKELLEHDPRHKLEEVLAAVAERPELALPLAKICRRIESGGLDLGALEKFADN